MKTLGHILLFVLVAAVGLAALVAPSRRAGAASESFIVIINPDNPASELDSSFLRDAYLKKVLAWRGDGEAIRPVDLNKKFPARERFTRDILKKSLSQLKRYWSQQIFSGKGTPPPEVDGEKAVIAYVLAHKGAIGYLPTGSDPGGAKVVKVK